jgi:hypothetical protein
LYFKWEWPICEDQAIWIPSHARLREDPQLRHDDSFDLLGLDFAPPAASTVEKPKVWTSKWVLGCLEQTSAGQWCFFCLDMVGEQATENLGQQI